MTPDNIKTVAHLLAGHEAGWQSRFASLMAISRGYAHNLLTGARPVTQALAVRMIQAAEAQAISLRARADELDGVMALVMPAPGESIAPVSDDQYQRDAAEAEAIIEELAFGPDNGGPQ